MAPSHASADLDLYLFDRDARRAGVPAAPEPLPGRSVRLVADDGTHLAARVFGGADRASPVVVVAGATGVRQRYYARFASFLAEAGLTVVTFDYRGVGGSLEGEVAASRATMREWGELDLAAAVRFAGAIGRGPVGLVGHSAGGQLVAFLPRPEALGAIVTVGSQSGDYRLWPTPARLRMALLWYGVVPAVTRAAGYLPGRLGIGEDLPPGVALEWARWCRTPGYYAGDATTGVAAGLVKVRAPVLAYSFDDDPYAPPRAVDALLSLYARAPVTRVRVDRAARLGHFGFFREAARDAHWARARAFLAAALDPRAAAA